MWANLLILFPSNKGGSKWHFQFYSSANQKNKQTNKPRITKPMCAESPLIKFLLWLADKSRADFFQVWCEVGLSFAVILSLGPKEEITSIRDNFPGLPGGLRKEEWTPRCSEVAASDRPTDESNRWEEVSTWNWYAPCCWKRRRCLANGTGGRVEGTSRRIPKACFPLEWHLENDTCGETFGQNLAAETVNK